MAEALHLLLFPFSSWKNSFFFFKHELFFFFWLHWVFAAHRLACGILDPQSEIKPTFPALESKFLTTGSPRKSPRISEFVFSQESVSPSSRRTVAICLLKDPAHSFLLLLCPPISYLLHLQWMACVGGCRAPVCPFERVLSLGVTCTPTNRQGFF